MIIKKTHPFLKKNGILINQQHEEEEEVDYDEFM